MAKTELMSFQLWRILYYRPYFLVAVMGKSPVENKAFAPYALANVGVTVTRSWVTPLSQKICVLLGSQSSGLLEDSAGEAGCPVLGRLGRGALSRKRV